MKYKYTNAAGYIMEYIIPHDIDSFDRFTAKVIKDWDDGFLTEPELINIAHSVTRRINTKLTMQKKINKEITKIVKEFINILKKL